MIPTWRYVESVAANVVLRQRIDDLDLTLAEVAARVNAEIEKLTGKLGKVSERTVYNWLSGSTSMPTAVKREALSAVFGCSIRELGFTSTAKAHQEPSEDAVLQRRDILRVGAATAGAAFVPARSPAPAGRITHRIGTQDVERLHQKFAEVVADDHKHGGRSSIENKALSLASEAQALQDKGSASQRVRDSLYACGAAFTSSAMWAAIDGRRFDSAMVLHQRAASLASMSGDPTIAFRIWSHAGSMYRHMGKAKVNDAVAANEVARRLSITARDPLFASLGHARHAAILGLKGDATGVKRVLDRAQDALDRADWGQPRPVWIVQQYDQAELDSLALAANLALGDFEYAEAYAHRSLALLRPHMERSRAITTARLARAQLGQDDLAHAVKTAQGIPLEQLTHPRIRTMMSMFSQQLVRQAPGSEQARLWDQYINDNLRIKK